MQESKYYLYLWRHSFIVDDTKEVITRTCFGITRNLDGRQNGYEGHVGHTIKFIKLWEGTERLIRDLETRIKQDFYDYLVCGHRNFRYEWITEEVDFETIVSYIDWEVSKLSGIHEVILNEQF